MSAAGEKLVLGLDRNRVQVPGRVRNPAEGGAGLASYG